MQNDYDEQCQHETIMHRKGESNDDDDDELKSGCGVKIRPLWRMVWTERRVS